jgi:hypothetical protein
MTRGFTRTRPEQAADERSRVDRERDRRQHLLALGPLKRKDGRWQGCRHFVPGRAAFDCVGPEPHEHLPDPERKP